MVHQLTRLQAEKYADQLDAYVLCAAWTRQGRATMRAWYSDQLAEDCEGDAQELVEQFLDRLLAKRTVDAVTAVNELQEVNRVVAQNLEEEQARRERAEQQSAEKDGQLDELRQELAKMKGKLAAERQE